MSKMLLIMSLECFSLKQKPSDQSRVEKASLERPKSTNLKFLDAVPEPQVGIRTL